MCETLCVFVLLFILSPARALICTCSSLILLFLTCKLPKCSWISKSNFSSHFLFTSSLSFIYALLLLTLLFEKKNQIFAVAAAVSAWMSGNCWFYFFILLRLFFRFETFHLRFTVAWWSFLHRVCPGPRSLPRANFCCTLAGERRMQTFVRRHKRQITDCLF